MIISQRNRSRGLRRGSALLLLAGVALGVSAWAASAQQGSPYRINPNDQLQVSVYGDLQLSGKFKVSADGYISYPILGSLHVASLTVQEVAGQLRQELVQQIPSGRTLTVEVSEYAPVFVLGDVEKSGPQEYRPGMIVMQLVSLAGGLRRLTAEAVDKMSQVLSVEQEAKDLKLERAGFVVQRMRLQAELSGVDFDGKAVALDDDVPTDAAQRIVADEVAIFASRRRSQLALQQSLKDQYAAFDQEISALERSVALYGDEIKLRQQEVAVQEGLVAKGLSTQPKLLDLRVLLSGMTRAALDLSTALARAHQAQFAVSQKIQEADNTRMNEDTLALREADIKIGRDEQAIASKLQILSELRVQLHAPAARSTSKQVFYSVLRVEDGQYKTVTVDEFTEVKPGDVLKVEAGTQSPITVSGDMVRDADQPGGRTAPE